MLRNWFEPIDDLTQAQLAVLMAETWPVEPRYRVTQEPQPAKAKRTLRQAMRVYIQQRKGRADA